MKATLQFITIVVLICVATDCHAKGKKVQTVPVVHNDKPLSLVSPDGSFTATSEGYSILIKEKQTGKEFSVDDTSVLSMNWTRDSKTLVFIEHAAMATQVALAHFDKGQWSVSRVDPTPEGEVSLYKFRIVKEEPGHSNVHLAFAGTGEDNELYYVEFDIIPGTNTYSNFKKRKLSSKEYNVLPYINLG